MGDLWSFSNDEGTVYGTTSFGGEDNLGTVYYSDPSRNFEDVIYNFKVKRDGAMPLAGLVLMNATLYGTTSRGGAHGFGTVFAIEIGGREHVIHDFRGPPSDGAAPQSQLAVMDGKLYGTTPHGGSANGGTLFMVTPAGAESVLVNFKRARGSAPVAGVLVHDKTLYGTTSRGGSADAGTIFAFSSGKITTLHTFKGGADGREPLSRLTAFNGVLYGTTYAGGTESRGTVFSLTP
ncbi:MAG TPA: choice-of-anchor tandem repeat GloVer-containing protein [Candidatus Nitrosotalea sp.]|nr:choice-of-anchor tandem repeat GloVer-containing protein [Candidatus Nitrosotalea sp.]